MAYITISDCISVDVYCNECGNSVFSIDGSCDQEIRVDMCDRCVEKKIEEAVKENDKLWENRIQDTMLGSIPSL